MKMNRKTKQALKRKKKRKEAIRMEPHKDSPVATKVNGSKPAAEPFPENAPTVAARPIQRNEFGVEFGCPHCKRLAQIWSKQAHQMVGSGRHVQAQCDGCGGKFWVVRSELQLIV